MIERVLIANRGEIAVRVADTLRRLGIASGGVHSATDRGARHVRAVDRCFEIEGVDGASPYLNLEAILATARHFGADGVHPGYGYLAEDDGAAKAFADAGLIWIGPPPEAIALLGDKARSKQVAIEAGTPVVPGLPETEVNESAARAFGDAHGYPLVLKASGGGGGKGMRRIDGPEQLVDGIAAARRESVAAFGSDRLLIERLIEPARHVEVQVAVDSAGGAVALGERECSLQRRYQKLIEETPSPVITPERRERLESAAIGLALAAGYRNLGTVEFLVDHEDPDHFYFLEMNARLQVEHPVTELVTGLDLVEMQVAIADGRPIGEFETGRRTGHAIEARICAERPEAGFLPATGSVLAYTEPAGVRCDSGIEAGSVVSSEFDPMLMKVIAHGGDRETAIDRLVEGLSELTILGVETNSDYLRGLLDDPRVRAGQTTTSLVESEEIVSAGPGVAAGLSGAAIALARDARRSGPGFEGLDAWRQTSPGWAHWDVIDTNDERHEVSARPAGGSLEIRVDRGELTGIPVSAGEPGVFGLPSTGTSWHHAIHGTELWVSGPDGTFRYEVPACNAELGAGAKGSLIAPLPGNVLSVQAEVGQRVAAGDLLMTLESMKMELEITAPDDGVVELLDVKPGDHVERGRALAVLAPAEGER